MVPLFDISHSEMIISSLSLSSTSHTLSSLHSTYIVDDLALDLGRKIESIWIHLIYFPNTQYEIISTLFSLFFNSFILEEILLLFSYSVESIAICTPEDIFYLHHSYLVIILSTYKQVLISHFKIYTLTYLLQNGLNI